MTIQVPSYFIRIIFYMSCRCEIFHALRGFIPKCKTYCGGEGFTIPQQPIQQPDLGHPCLYEPNYQDYHSSGLAGLFINIKQVFPCTEKIDNCEPVCKTFSREEYGFRGGKAFIEAGDIGNNMKVFSGSSVYALAVQDCWELDGSCFPNYLQVEVVCMLPRYQCP